MFVNLVEYIYFLGIGTGFMPMAVSSAAYADRVRSICRKVVKEVSAAAGPGGMAVVDGLDAACDAIDKKDEHLSDGGKLFSVCVCVCMRVRVFVCLCV